MKKLILLILPLIMIGCKNLVPLTSKLVSDNGWQQTEMQQIQYYNSESIILNRNIKNDETNIVSGKIKTINGRQVEEIIIKTGTPGIVTTFPDSERMAISFEISDEHYLVFGIDEQRGGKYCLRLKEYKKNQYAKVTYTGKTYLLAPQSLNAYLQVNLKKINHEQRKMRIAKGRSL